MKKIPSVFQRNYETDRQCRDEVVEGCEWVLAGEGIATIKWDGTCCLIKNGRLYRRYDRKLTKAAHKQKRAGKTGPWVESDCKPAPDGWIACEPEPNQHTGHWPGWLLVGDEPESEWHREAFANFDIDQGPGTYELVGPKVQGNPHGLESHTLWKHGTIIVTVVRNYAAIRDHLSNLEREGIVFHHPDGRMAKVKRRDFGLAWPLR